MRTLLLAPELFRAEGGIARILRCYLRALAELTPPGGRVDCLALNDAVVAPGGAERYLAGRGGRVAGANRGKWRFVLSALRLAFDADRVVCGHLNQLVVAWVARGLGARFDYYLVAHGIDVWRPFGFLEKRALRGAGAILCVSEYTRRQVLRFDPGLDPARLVVVPNTIEEGFAGNVAEARERATVERPAVRSGGAEGAAGAFPRLLTVSRLTRDDSYKGIDLAIEAMPAVRREFPGAVLRIVGGGDDRGRLESLARRLGLVGSPNPGPDAPMAGSPGDAVQFAGIVPDDVLRAEYEQCDLFVLPSRKEGFGLVYLEAMSHGKPCIAARAGGAPEVVGDPGEGRISYSARQPGAAQAEDGGTAANDGTVAGEAGPGPSLPATGHTSVGALVEYGNIEELAVAVADLARHPRDPAAMTSRARGFAYAVFKRRLAEALANREHQSAGRR